MVNKLMLRLPNGFSRIYHFQTLRILVLDIENWSNAAQLILFLYQQSSISIPVHRGLWHSIGLCFTIVLSFWITRIASAGLDLLDLRIFGCPMGTFQQILENLNFSTAGVE